MTRRQKPPEQIPRAGNPHPHIRHYLGRLSQPETPPRRRAKIRAVIGPCHPQRRRQPPRTTRQLASGSPAAPVLHDAIPSPWLDRPQEHEAILLALHQHVKHPMHAVVQIHISRPRRMPIDEFPGRRTRECMTRRITLRRVGFAFDDDSAAPAPHQLTPHQRPRTLHRRLREKFPRNHSGTRWSTNFHGTRNFFPKCAAKACTPSVSVA